MRLKELRINEKKEVKEIANMLNISEQAYYKYESYRNEPSISNLIKLADFYQVSLDYLVGRTFNDDIGYLDKAEKDIITNYRQMTETNKVRFVAESYGVLIGQS